MKRIFFTLLALIVIALAATGGPIYFSRHKAAVPIEQTYGPSAPPGLWKGGLQ